MNQKSIRPLKTLDLLSLLALIGIVVSISGAIISREMKDVDQTLAMSEAQSLAFQLVNGGFTAPKASSGSRSIASVEGQTKIDERLGIFKNDGRIGSDPWGRSFQYRVLRDENSRATHVVVWSHGPNEKAETKESKIVTSYLNGDSQISFDGDDFGFVQAIDSQSQNEAEL